MKVHAMLGDEGLEIVAIYGGCHDELYSAVSAQVSHIKPSVTVDADEYVFDVYHYYEKETGALIVKICMCKIMRRGFVVDTVEEWLEL